MKRFRTPRGAFFLLLAVCCVLLAYYLMNLKAEKSKPEDYVKLTKVQEVLSRDLKNNYRFHAGYRDFASYICYIH